MYNVNTFNPNAVMPTAFWVPILKKLANHKEKYFMICKKWTWRWEIHQTRGRREVKAAASFHGLAPVAKHDSRLDSRFSCIIIFTPLRHKSIIFRFSYFQDDPTFTFLWIITIWAYGKHGVKVVFLVTILNVIEKISWRVPGGDLHVRQTAGIGGNLKNSILSSNTRVYIYNSRA